MSKARSISSSNSAKQLGTDDFLQSDNAPRREVPKSLRSNFREMTKCNKIEKNLRMVFVQVIKTFTAPCIADDNPKTLKSSSCGYRIDL